MIPCHTTPRKQSSASVQSDAATIDTTEPPPHSDISIEHWRTICQDVARLAPDATHFWPVWQIICRRHLRRYNGRTNAGVVFSGVTFYSLFEIYEAAGGRGTPWEPWVEARSNKEVDAA